MTLRKIARSATILVALGFAVGAWVWFPGNSIGGRWTASSPQQSLDIVVTQQPDGSVRGNGVMIDRTLVEAATVPIKVEGVRSGERVALSILSEQHTLAVVILELKSRRELAGEISASGRAPAPVALTRP